MSSVSPSQDEINKFVDAGFNGELAVIQQMLGQYGKNIINGQQSNGNTALMLAAVNGYTDCVLALLRAGANTDLKNNVSNVFGHGM